MVFRDFYNLGKVKEALPVLTKFKKLSLENKKSELEILGKLTEETGEVAQALLSSNKASGSEYKEKILADVHEECVDVIMVAMSLMYKTGATETELLEILKGKTDKWERVTK